MKLAAMRHASGRAAALLAIAVLALTLACASSVSAVPAQAVQSVDAKIEIVWPQGNLPVTQARRVNITAYLFEPNTARTVGCDFNNTVRLWQALNNNPVSSVATGTRRLVSRNGVTFPVWDFNDIDVSAARDPLNKYYFYVTVDGVTTNFNVWSHGADARTYLPNPPVPSGSGGRPDQVDARIQVVWPHSANGQAQPVSRATLANISVALFYPGSQRSVGTDFDRTLFLYRGLNNNPVDLVGKGVKRIVRQGNVSYPVWDFNDVDVSGARDPINKYYFRVLVDNTQTFSTIWSHGVDARTYFPTVDQPTGGCQTGGGSNQDGHDVGDVVRAFYSWYTLYPGNVLANRAYRTSPYLTQGMIQKVDAMLSSPRGPGFDPFVCAQNRIAGFVVDPVTVNPPQARAVVRTTNPSNSFTVALNNTSGSWKISDVTCDHP